MKNKIKMTIIALFSLLIILAMAGCKKNADSDVMASYSSEELGYNVSESDNKVIFVYPIAGEEVYADSVTAVLVTDENNSESYEFENHSGAFVLSSELEEGTYEITACCAGYETETRVVVIDEDSLYMLRMDLEIESE